MWRIEARVQELCGEFKATCGGLEEDYFGLAYLEDEFHVAPDRGVNQIAFGGSDYGIDGFHYDIDSKNFYIFQFKYTESNQFRGSMERLRDRGIELVFDSPNSDRNKNQVINQLLIRLGEYRDAVKKVYFRFVFLGDPESIERSQVIDKLKEDLENRRHFIEKYFGRSLDFIIEFRNYTGKNVLHSRPTHPASFEVEISEYASYDGPNGERLHIGFIGLEQLHEMYTALGTRFFERNIRYGLGGFESVNRAITRSLKSIIIDRIEPPEVFAFNHNGISLCASGMDKVSDNMYSLSSPSLLNGAQTVTTYAEFLECNAGHPQIKKRSEVASRMKVLCKIITNAKNDFIVTTAINNNRQNPVEPWNLHANDMIQLELQDAFREVGIYYERQEGAFEASEPDDDEQPLDSKPIELVRLAQTYIVSDGQIQKLSNLRQVFEDDSWYSQVFSGSRLGADFRQVVLCYKIQFRLKKFLKDIERMGEKKYSFVAKARNLTWALLCQGLLNHPNLSQITQDFGNDLTMPASYVDALSWIATNRCRFMLSNIVDDPKYAEKVDQGNFSFLRNGQAFEHCMSYAADKWGWAKRRLVKMY